MLTVRGQQHSFSTHDRVFLWKCQSFWDRKYLDLRGTRTPNLRIHAECSNLLSYQGQTFAVPWFEHWPWRFRYFFVKMSKVFETENISTWGGLEPPTFGFMPNALTYWATRARHLLSHGLNTGPGGLDIFLSKVNIWNVNCARATAFIFDTRTGDLLDIFPNMTR